MSQELDKYTILFGTSKDSSARLFSSLTGKQARTFNIEKFDTEKKRTQTHEAYVEPSDENPLVPARSKSKAVLDRYEKEDDENVAVVTADVVFAREGEVVHKEERNQNFKLGGLLETFSRVETENWYCLQAFTVHWLIALTLQTNDGHKIETKFTVKGQYHSPLAFEKVQAEYDPTMNTRIPLVEQRHQVPTNFYWVTDAGEELPLSPDLAEQLIVQRVLPPELFWQMVEGLSAETAKAEWKFVYLDYQQYLRDKVEVI